MKLFSTNLITAVAGFGLIQNAHSELTCGATWKCQPTTSTPTLDADHSEWDGVESYATDLVNSATGTEYVGGAANLKCLYDVEHIYFALEIPGDYRFDATDNHLCAAIGFMFKMGEKAGFSNMGACPEAMAGCDDGVPEVCLDYKVDIGAHWELATTEPNTLYEVSSTVAQGRQAAGEGSGNDPIANKDDEYAVSPYCRFDDDDAMADNEWAGAWTHTNMTDEAEGIYRFEMSRKLKTASTTSDAQLTPGMKIEMGIAFWDPFDDEEIGWTAINHYVTGCAASWIELELVANDNATPDDITSAGVVYGFGSVLLVTLLGLFRIL